MHSIYSSLESSRSNAYSPQLNFFHYLLQLRRYKWKPVEVSVFSNGVGHFRRIFQREGGITHKPLLVLAKYGVIALSCGIKISAVHYLVLSEYTHLNDRQTELRQ